MGILEEARKLRKLIEQMSTSLDDEEALDILMKGGMMKAILVVDLDGDISRYHADIYKEDDKGNGEIVKSYCPLKPMPNKKNECYCYGELAKNEFAVGFNACLKEITE